MQGIRQVQIWELESNEGIFLKKMKNNEIKNEIDEIKISEEENKRKGLKCKAKKYIYDFQQYETTRSFGDNIYTGKINVDEAEMDQSNIIKNIVEFNYKSRPRIIEAKDKNGRELIFNALKNGIFLIKET